ncbi:hypothetical protein [Psychromonas arctica]|uniref:hypothetical protein n=1 Tax=Psychromonas arctica TaxID=168275 RepID=UPI002FCF3031
MNKFLLIAIIAGVLFFYYQDTKEKNIASENRISLLIEEVEKGEFSEKEKSEIKEIVSILFYENTKHKKQKPQKVTSLGVKLLIKQATKEKQCKNLIDKLLSAIELGGEYRTNFIANFLEALTSSARDIVVESKVCHSVAKSAVASGLYNEFYKSSNI